MQFTPQPPSPSERHVPHVPKRPQYPNNNHNFATTAQLNAVFKIHCDPKRHQQETVWQRKFGKDRGSMLPILHRNPHRNHHHHHNPSETNSQATTPRAQQSHPVTFPPLVPKPPAQQQPQSDGNAITQTSSKRCLVVAPPEVNPIKSPRPPDFEDTNPDSATFDAINKFDAALIGGWLTSKSSRRGTSFYHNRVITDESCERVTKALFQLQLALHSSIMERMRKHGSQKFLKQLTKELRSLGLSSNKQLSREELHAVLCHTLGDKHINTRESSIMFDLFDGDQSGLVTCDEFLEGVKYLVETNANELAFKIMAGLVCSEEKSVKNSLISRFELELLMHAVVAQCRVYGRDEAVVAKLSKTIDTLDFKFHRGRVPVELLQKAVRADDEMMALFESMNSGISLMAEDEGAPPPPPLEESVFQMKTSQQPLSRSVVVKDSKKQQQQQSEAEKEDGGPSTAMILMRLQPDRFMVREWSRQHDASEFGEPSFFIKEGSLYRQEKGKEAELWIM